MQREIYTGVHVQDDHDLLDRLHDEIEKSDPADLDALPTQCTGAPEPLRISAAKQPHS